jgi:hypothetical protein
MCSSSRLLLVLVFFTLLCSCALALGEGNVSGPELVWKYFEPSESSRAKDIVSCDYGGFAIAMERVDQGSTDQGVKIGLIKVDHRGNMLWEKAWIQEDLDMGEKMALVNWLTMDSYFYSNPAIPVIRMNPCYPESTGKEALSGQWE